MICVKIVTHGINKQFQTNNSQIQIISSYTAKYTDLESDLSKATLTPSKINRPYFMSEHFFKVSISLIH